MKASNSPLERKRPLLFAIGLLFAFSLTLVSFEWRIPYKEIVISAYSDGLDEDPIWIPVTLPEPEKKLAQPDSPTVIRSEKFDIIESTADMGEEQFDPSDIEVVEGSPIGEPEDEGEEPDEVYFPIDNPEVMPKYCTGEAGLFKFLMENLEYPDIPRENGVTGVVYIQFVVGKDGSVRDAKVIRPIDPWLDGEALRVTKLLNCFTPGKQGGRAVDVYFRLPIRFTLGG